ncbi:hypothetical protein [Nocardioides sp. KR10-350]|uniref:hypothetical protein n=1 Tax=Nocardioides cheoyonin TaxID=3156615 RepID=UPI0032B5FA4B
MQHRWLETSDGAHHYDSEYCPSTGGRPAQPALTIGRITEAFKRIYLPAAPLKIDPPHGKTLVNLDTVFYTTQKPFTRTIHLLGHRIDFRIRASRYTWHFGDGHWTVTDNPGKPFTTQAAHVHDISHKYLSRDTFQPSLDTTYTADFRVDGGAWRDVNGTVTIQGPTQNITAVTATPVLVG